MSYCVGEKVYYNGFIWTVTDTVEKRGHTYYGLNNLSLEIPEDVLLPPVYFRNPQQSLVDIDAMEINCFDENTDKILGTFKFSVGKQLPLTTTIYGFVYDYTFVPFTLVQLFLYTKGESVVSEIDPSKIVDKKDLFSFFYFCLKELRGMEGFSFTGTVEDYIKY